MIVRAAGPLATEKNVFTNLIKYVLPAHVQTDTHWRERWRAAALANYDRYGWEPFGRRSGPS